jgi:hypothetical protein
MEEEREEKVEAAKVEERVFMVFIIVGGRLFPVYSK